MVPELAGRGLRTAVPEGRQRFLAAVDEQHAHRRRVEGAELAAEAP